MGYENKKTGALKTLEKKQKKVDEINTLLSEEITPTLEKLQRERANYMLWVSNNNEIEQLQRFCVAYEYVQVKQRLEDKHSKLSKEVVAMESKLKNRESDLEAQMES